MPRQFLDEVLTVDPGDNTGYAYWGGNAFPSTGLITYPKRIHRMERQLKHLYKDFSKVLKEFNPEIIYIEGVEFWEGSLKSVTSAKRQNLSKLSYVVGGYANECLRAGKVVRIIPAREWKGQMSKDIIAQKIKRANGMIYPTDHISDAVGIGFSIMGYFLNTKNQPRKFKKVKKGTVEGWI